MRSAATHSTPRTQPRAVSRVNHAPASSALRPLLLPRPRAHGGGDAPCTSSVGIVIVDHGSRKKDSNDMLHEFGRLYQDLYPSAAVIEVAHMEIAEPSIKDAIGGERQTIEALILMSLIGPPSPQASVLRGV